MAKKLCNACVLQNWTFDSREEALSWLQFHEALDSVDVLYFGQICGNEWHVTVSRRYNNSLMTQPGQIATIGALIAGYEFDHAAVLDVEEELIYGRYTLDEWNSLSEDEQISIQDKCEYDLQHPDQAEWGVE